MKSLDKFFQLFDRKVDQETRPFMPFFQKNFIIFSSSFVSILFVTLLVWFYYSKSDVLNHIVTEDLKALDLIFNQIDKECNILGIKGNGISIDFLNVEKFVGSVIGGMSLAYPEKWNGPYLKENPSLKGIYYEFVKAKDGYFIIPGRGATLPNGVVMGKDLIISVATPILPLLKEGGKLFYKGTAYGLQLHAKIGDWDSPFKGSSEASDKKSSESLEEFNEALSFASNASALQHG